MFEGVVEHAADRPDKLVFLGDYTSTVGLTAPV
jgi:hypothetical protein